MEQLLTRQSSIWVSRVVIAAVVLGALGSYFWTPSGPVELTLDLLLRTYLHFVAGAMAHEAVHGHLGNSRAANLWWGRLALLPTTVPYATFRKTHLLHHAFTNDREKDPDAFIDTPRRWEIPLRAVAMPHQWILFLRRHGKLTRALAVEYAGTYLVYLGVFAVLAGLVGPYRVLTGLLPAAVLHSLILWIPFAMKTHEGYSTAAPEARSHNYYGHLAFFFSFGLSLHRVHHLRPRLSWVQMLPLVEPGSWWQALTFRRSILRGAGSSS